MPDSKEDIEAKFKELKKKLTGLNKTATAKFTPAAMIEFCRGFDELIFGTIEFLKSNIQYYQDILCEVKGHNFGAIQIQDYHSYQLLSEKISCIVPKNRIELTFRLTNGIWPRLPNVQEVVEVFFSETIYSLLYTFKDKQELRIEKQYYTHLTPIEIKSLRNEISESVYRKILNQIEN